MHTHTHTRTCMRAHAHTHARTHAHNTHTYIHPYKIILRNQVRVISHAKTPAYLRLNGVFDSIIAAAA